MLRWARDLRLHRVHELTAASPLVFGAPALSRAFRATPPSLLAAYQSPESQRYAKPQRWRWEEPGLQPGSPRPTMRPMRRKFGEPSLLDKLDAARIERGEKPRRLIKTRKRIAHARHTHIARFRLRSGPAPRVRPEWDDPERVTRDAMIQFVDPYELDPDMPEPGRRWHAAEIRLKSNEDLQKLWIILLKERNMLHSTRLLHRKRKTTMPHRSRLTATRKSMAMIKLVLHERQLEKAERDASVAFERQRERALTQLDLPESDVWPPFLPGGDRLMPLAQRLTFNVVVRTSDGEPPVVRPPASELGLSLHVDGEALAPEMLDAHIVVRPPARSRPDELSYACHVTVRGDVLPRSRFLQSSTALREDGAPVQAELAATLYGRELGGGRVPVVLGPSKRLKKRVKMAEINVTMSETLSRAREDAAREAGIELPPPSPSPPPTEYWRPLNTPLLDGTSTRAAEASSAERV